MHVDLHLHSIYSDGNLSPEEIVDASVEAGLSTIAITDHDNVIAHSVANKYISEEKASGSTKDFPEVITGVEVNTLYKGLEIHILGYFMDVNAKPFLELIKYQQHARIQQAVNIVERLVKEGLNISLEKITELMVPGGSLGRPHIAKAIVNCGGARSNVEAYAKYISDSSKTYVARKTVSPHEAAEAIYDSGGIPVIAHPCDLEGADAIIKDLMSFGLRGIEAYHRKHSPAMIEYYSSLAEELGLVVTGGSDCHGSRANKQLYLGKNHVPKWIIDKLKIEKNHLEIASG